MPPPLTAALDWSLAERKGDLHRFVTELSAFTQSLEVFRQRMTIATAYTRDRAYVTWHGVRLHQPDSGADSHSLAFTLELPSANEQLHVILNACWEELEFELPELGSGKLWKRIVDTSLSPPLDISILSDAAVITKSTYSVKPRSNVILLADKGRD
ncbi:MAG: hypothetical protein K2Z81_08405 [Cyanobacteria bacterium]|nr:hypothetical protein [Cyanobacteriota bacterium]